MASTNQIRLVWQSSNRIRSGWHQQTEYDWSNEIGEPSSRQKCQPNCLTPGDPAGLFTVLFEVFHLCSGPQIVTTANKDGRLYLLNPGRPEIVSLWTFFLRKIVCFYVFFKQKVCTPLENFCPPWKKGCGRPWNCLSITRWNLIKEMTQKT